MPSTYPNMPSIYLCPRSNQTCPRPNQLYHRSSQLWRSLFAMYVLDQGLYGGPNDVLLNFRGQTPKKLKFWERIGLSNLKEKKFKSLYFENYLADHYEIFTGSTHQNEPPWVVSRLTPNKSKMAAAAIFNFGKMSITPDWTKISAPNFMERCITAVRRWPRD